MDFYRAEQAGSAWLCIKGDDFYSAADYGTEQEAQDAADELNGRWYADGRPANASAHAIAEVSHVR